MKTLLEKVQAVEQRAEALIAEAEQAGQTALAELGQREPMVLASVRERALEQSKKIVAEAVAKAHAEKSRILQDERLITDSIQNLARTNEAEGLALASQLFSDEYL